jgi:protein SCO1
MSIRYCSLRQFLVSLATVAALAGVVEPAAAQLADQVPDALEEVGVVEHLDAKLPLEATFFDEDGERVTLGSFFDGERPVILTLNYYRCPMLCGLMLNGVVDGFEAMDWTPGVEFDVVTISINPLETPALAREKKQNYLKRLGRPEAAGGWHFLTGYEPQIDRVAEALGFSYAYDPETGEYAHAAAIFVATPDGRVAR